MTPDFFLFLMWFLSPVLSSEYRKSFCLPCAMKDMFQETPPGPTSALHPWWWWWGGHADSLDIAQEVDNSKDSHLRKINV